jgi:hypothetical protein
MLAYAAVMVLGPRARTASFVIALVGASSASGCGGGTTGATAEAPFVVAGAAGGPSSPTTDGRRGATGTSAEAGPPKTSEPLVQEPPASLVASSRSSTSARSGASFAGAGFPPADVTPPFPRSAVPGDGRWQPVADGMRDGRPVMVRMKLHIHPTRPDKSIEVVAIDRAAVEPVLVVGKSEPPAPTVAAERRTGLVPVEDRARLLGVFNGGFMQRHGKWGMIVGEDVFTPPREDGCSIVAHRDGRLRIGLHASLALGAPPLGDVAWLRQTPPCLVENGVVNERVLREPGHVIWGKAVDGKFDIRRSALALDRGGRVLYYVFSDWNAPNEFAKGLVALGVDAAAELDVNWSYTWFYWFEGQATPSPRIREALVPKAKYDPRGFVERPADRDFFYLRERVPSG